MYKDAKQWQEIRHRVLVRGVSKRQIIRETGMAWGTLQRILAHPLPQPYKHRQTTSAKAKPPSGTRSQDQVWQDVLQALSTANVSDSRFIISAVSAINHAKATKQDLDALKEKLLERGIVAGTTDSCLKQPANHDWLLSIMQGDLTAEQIRAEVGDNDHLPELVDMAREGNLKQRNRALSILAFLKGISLRSVARFLCVSLKTVLVYWARYRNEGPEELFKLYRNTVPRKAQRKKVQDAVFSVLHSPPSDFDINRTTWKMDDLKSCLSQNGHGMSRDVIREVIKSAGYRWRKARIVLTSPDPKYREKLEHIHSILSTLGEKDRFFSIDEFGPCAIKMKGGRRLVAPNDYSYVPQIQKSKGFLIVTAALELSTNQVTHFYSWKKNTVEMLRLLHLLLEQYKGCRKLYFSWDAASWHASKRLYKEVAKVNSEQYRATHGTAAVELAPLPASAQFLNVIESIFSGLARAIIHNSNYQSFDEARDAIDRYFRERNEHFLLHPKRAGKKIWGKELVLPKFDETQNCKDPRW